ncbi:hypothetical protein OsI_34048 [Oryza sativa Indica Group]|uniref:Sugar phosphate transporter domain-containing protein n=1 Tax=Oryza sativa subsp. indica TaxID=39946 RepID=B8BHH8_ORYSI|nr:hypothetical protein OsI_34048 [Oryza sativa Indica Group]
MSSATDGAASRLGVAGALGMSVTSSVAIVICNKYLISTLGFFFATTLTSWHLMVTFCTLYVAQRLRFFEAKPIDAQTVISFGLLNGISIGLLNLCLGFNSVGFYQASTIHFADPNHCILAFIVLSCSIAVCVDFSTFLVIGTTSPVTYQVLGHLKTCLILSFGYVLLRDPFTFRNVAGILVAIFGMGLYSFFSVSESRDKKLSDGPSPPLPISSSQMGEMKDSEPLLGGGGGAAAKSSPWNEVKGLQSFDEVPRTAKSAFSRP